MNQDRLTGVLFNEVSDGYEVSIIKKYYILDKAFGVNVQHDFVLSDVAKNTLVVKESVRLLSRGREPPEYKLSNSQYIDKLIRR